MTADLPDFADIVRKRMATALPTVISGVEERIGRIAVERLERVEGPPGPYLRASGLGSCARQLAYQLTSTPPNGRVHDGRRALTFAQGDIAEALVTLALAEALMFDAAPGWGLSGVRVVDGTQLKVTYQTSFCRVPGHPDGVVTYDGRVVGPLEIKCVAGHRWKKWANKATAGYSAWDRSVSYWWQLQSYIHGLGAARAYVLVVDRETGAVGGWWEEADPAFHRDLAVHLMRVASPLPPRVLTDGTPIAPVVDLHKRRGTPNKGHGKLPWQCSFCAYYRHCWGPDLDERVEDGALVLRLRPGSASERELAPTVAAAMAAAVAAGSTHATGDDLAEEG